jgi:hypothetical protein
MSKLTNLLRRAKRYLFPKPTPPAYISQDILIQQAVDFFNIPVEIVQALYRDYKKFHQEQQYEQNLGERKTLSFEEAFLLYLVTLLVQPRNLVEIGTQYGKSTRRIIDILHFAGMNSCKVLCFDIVDQVQFFTPEEARLELHDVTKDFREYVLDKLKPELIFLDARPYPLLKNVIAEYLDWTKTNPAILAIHDCSARLFNPRMRIKMDKTEKITSRSGVWERHVLSELFKVPQKKLDDTDSLTHRLKIFQTPHGLALILPKCLESRRIE